MSRMLWRRHDMFHTDLQSHGRPNVLSVFGCALQRGFLGHIVINACHLTRSCCYALIHSRRRGWLGVRTGQRSNGVIGRVRWLLVHVEVERAHHVNNCLQQLPLQGTLGNEYEFVMQL